jgi:hypothetical protein
MLVANFIRLVLVCGLALASSNTLAASKKELEKGIEQKIQVTKRSWTGKIKEPGTVLVIKAEGIPASAQRIVMHPVFISEDGIDESNVIQDGENWRDLRIGERVLVYRIDLKTREVGIIVGTESQSQAVKLGDSVEDFLTTYLVFQFENKIESYSVDEVLQRIYEVMIADSRIETEELMAASQAIAGTPIPFRPEVEASLKGKREREAKEARVAASSRSPTTGSSSQSNGTATQAKASRRELSVVSNVEAPEGSPETKEILTALQSRFARTIPGCWVGANIDGRLLSLDSIEVVQWGRVRESEGYATYPVRIRIRGVGEVVPPFGKGWTKRFDEIAEFRFTENDFGEWRNSFNEPNAFSGCK